MPGQLGITLKSLIGQRYVPSNTGSLSVVAIDGAYDGANNFIRTKNSNLSFAVVDNGALANGASANILAAPGVGFTNWIRAITITSSIAGKINIQVNAIDIWIYLAVANTPYDFKVDSGGFINLGNVATTVVNNTGSVARILTSAAYTTEGNS